MYHSLLKSILSLHIDIVLRLLYVIQLDLVKKVGFKMTIMTILQESLPKRINDYKNSTISSIN